MVYCFRKVSTCERQLLRSTRLSVSTVETSVLYDSGIQHVGRKLRICHDPTFMRLARQLDRRVVSAGSLSASLNIMPFG